MLIGYARVSTQDQDLTMQLDALRDAGCQRFYSDKASGAKISRPGLLEAIAYARPGDVLVVWKLDRLGRTMKGLVDLAAELEEKGIGLRSITDGIDTSGTAGRLVFNILAAMAQMERELIRERTTSALAVARRKGRFGGRKSVMTDERRKVVESLIASKMHPREIARAINVSLSTFYRHFPGRAVETEDAGDLAT